MNFKLTHETQIKDDQLGPKKEPKKKKSTVMGIDIGVSPWIDMVSWFELVSFNLVRKHTHLILFFSSDLSMLFLFPNGFWL